MNREELLRSPEYWLAHIQSNLYAMMEDYRKTNNLKKKDIAEKLGVTKGYISQVLNGDFDHKISKLVNLSLALNKVPIINYQDLDEYVEKDKHREYFSVAVDSRPIQFVLMVENQCFQEISSDDFKHLQHLCGSHLPSDPVASIGVRTEYSQANLSNKIRLSTETYF